MTPKVRSERVDLVRISLIKCQNASSYNRMDLGEDIFLGYLLPLLRRTPHDVTIDDHAFAYFDTLDDLRRRATSTLADKPDLILFSIRQNTSNLFFTLQYVTLLRRLGYQGAIGVFGDTGVDLPQVLRDHDVTFVVTGDELSVLDLVNRCAHGAPLSSEAPPQTDEHVGLGSCRR